MKETREAELAETRALKTPELQGWALAVWAPEVTKSSGHRAGKAPSTLAAFSTWRPPLAQRQSLPQALVGPLPSSRPWNSTSSLWLEEPRSHSVPQVGPPALDGISIGGHSVGSGETSPCGFRNHFIKDRYPARGLRT